MKRRKVVALLALPVVPRLTAAHAVDLQTEVSVTADEAQARLMQAMRVIRCLERLGEPLPSVAVTAVADALNAGNVLRAAQLAVEALEGRVLAHVAINPEGRVVSRRVARHPQLVQGGWRAFVIRLSNPFLVPGKLAVHSAQALPTHGVTLAGIDPIRIPTSRGDIAQRWIDLAVHVDSDVQADLETAPVDYKIVLIYARDSGVRSAELAFDIGPGTGDLGMRNRIELRFAIAAARRVQVQVVDDNDEPTTCSWLIRDSSGRVVPSQAKRSPPDFYFQQKIYRASGEEIHLPPGEYTVTTSRGPEYIEVTTLQRVEASGATVWRARLKRWIDPQARHWYSGDHHIHAAGCAHYDQPEAGVGPEMILPQVKGEALAIAGVLTWGPGFSEQRKHFSGRDDPLSHPKHLLHYDLEVSGFPSSHCGHLALLRLKTIDFPGARSIEDWPSRNAPVLRWARGQGAITGYAHAGSGLWTGSTSLPNFDIPPFDGIGANDYIVTLPAGLVDFIGVCNHPQSAELNIWYHTLNLGLRSTIAGETDWPCFFEESVGMGRSYVLLREPLSYPAWCEGLRAGRSYVSEGRVHFLECRAQGRDGTAGVGGELALDGTETITVTTEVAARLEPRRTARTDALRSLAPLEKPYWHIERSRLGDSREVPLELIFNGRVVATQSLLSDGQPRVHQWSFTPTCSGWLALRVPNAGHTNPIWVTVAGSKVWVADSARWCARAVDACWDQKKLRIRPDELEDERGLYDKARAFYRIGQPA